MKNLHMTVSTSSAAVAWESDDGAARFHVWLEMEQGEPLRPFRFQVGRYGPDVGKGTLYKNCPLDLKRHDSGYFKTRHLDPTSKPNAAMIAQALAQAEADQLLENTRAEDAARAEKQARDLVADMADGLRTAMMEFSRVDPARVPTTGITTNELVAMIARYATDKTLVELATAMRMAKC